MSFIVDNSQFFSMLISFTTFLLIICVGVFNYWSHFKITGNDLKHLTIDVKEITTKQEALDSRLSELYTTTFYIKGKLDTILSDIK